MSVVGIAKEMLKMMVDMLIVTLIVKIIVVSKDVDDEI